MVRKNKAFIISVSIETGCYRHIKISGEATLEELSNVILEAFDFDNDHAHAFFMDNRAWSDADSYFLDMDFDDEDDNRHTCDYTLCKAGMTVDKRFIYVFDFGDDWQFHCRVLRELDEVVEESEIVCVKGEPPAQYDFEDLDSEDT